MKRMVKNGDLIDVEPDGTITVAGKPVGGGGGDYTAGSNIEISESKEISLKGDITEINSFRFSGKTSPLISSSGSAIKIKSKSISNEFPSIFLYPYSDNNPDRYIYITFLSDNYNVNSGITIDHRGLTGDAYAFLTKGSKVPFVPTGNGTYVLKATVSGGAVTYTWVAQ